MLHAREIGAAQPRVRRKLMHHLFRKIKYKRSFDLCSLSRDEKHIFAGERCKLAEIIPAKDLLICVNTTGLAVVLDMETGKHLCILNPGPSLVLRRAVYIPEKDCIFSLFVCRQEDFKNLHCYETTLNALRQQNPERCRRIFESENLRHPAYVDIDPSSNAIVTLNVERKFRVWDMITKKLIFDAPPGIDKLHVTRDFVLVAYPREVGYVRFSIFDIHSGRCVSTFQHLLKRGAPVDIIELMEDRLIVKQRGAPADVVNLATYSMAFSIPSRELNSFQDVAWLEDSHLLLTHADRQVIVRDRNGNIISRFKDNAKRTISNQFMASPIFLAKSDVTINFANMDESSDVRPQGCLQFRDIKTGEVVHTIAEPDSASCHCALNGPRCAKCSLVAITTMAFDDKSHSLVTGSSDGVLTVWGV